MAFGQNMSTAGTRCRSWNEATPACARTLAAASAANVVLPGAQGPTHGPDSTTARWKRPAARGEHRSTHTAVPPALCPAIVMRAGSPPKAVCGVGGGGVRVCKHLFARAP